MIVRISKGKYSPALHTEVTSRMNAGDSEDTTSADPDVWPLHPDASPLLPPACPDLP